MNFLLIGLTLMISSLLFADCSLGFSSWGPNGNILGKRSLQKTISQELEKKLRIEKDYSSTP